ncbi:MAG: hypothetical protein LBU97_01985, partial [Alistipes sp.]|nr:hypothetical protein [Alistipes sp.]
MKNRIRRAMAPAVAVLFVVLCASSCKEPPVVNPPRGVTLSGDTSAAFDDTRIYLNVVASVEWTLTVTKGGEWLKTNGTTGGGAGSTRVELILSENSGDEMRTGEITVRAAGEADPYLFTVTQSSSVTLTGVNRWIHETLSDWYYWNDVVRDTPPPSNALEYDEFLAQAIEHLPWNRVQDTSSGENPPTIDGVWARDDNGRRLNVRRHIYSNIERLAPGTRASASEPTTFGFGFLPVRMLGSGGVDTGLYQLLVTWVLPGGVADKAGLKRGMWIAKYGGETITYDDYVEFLYLLYYLQGGTSMSITDDGGKVYDLTAQPTRNSPTLHHEVITTPGGRKVAYLVYNAFETGEGGEF